MFLAFFRVGLFTIGGGLAMVPLMEDIAVRKEHWLTEEEMVDCLAVSQSMPGVVAVNTATYIGNKRRGFTGALAATLGVIAPSFLVIALLVTFLWGYIDNPYVLGALRGIKAALCGMVGLTVARMGRQVLKGAFSWLVAIAVFAAAMFLHISVIFAILAAAAAGVVRVFCRERRGDAPNAGGKGADG